MAPKTQPLAAPTGKPLDLILLPSGHLRLIEGNGPEARALPEALGATLAKAFEDCTAEGLLQLAVVRHDAGVPARFSYWRQFGERYLTELCRTPQTALDLKPMAPPPSANLAELAGSAPPMRGGEYLRPETLEPFD